jgi:hypothetical protein
MQHVNRRRWSHGEVEVATIIKIQNGSFVTASRLLLGWDIWRSEDLGDLRCQQPNGSKEGAQLNI